MALVRLFCFYPYIVELDLGCTWMHSKRSWLTSGHVTAFTVPETHDMVSQLLSPSEPKNLSDAIVLAILSVHILLMWQLPAGARIPVFAVVYLFWRACYNAGIGWLLHNQSHHNTLIRWAEQTKIFVHPSTGKNPRPQLYDLIKRELEVKIRANYSFDKAPIEYNTWLVFRRVVDLILMCDFTSYCLFAIACSHHPSQEGPLMTTLRWSSGIVLVLFNLWVKLDAHRVVKDYAWYWGDFFYLLEGELTFDGVFEMAPPSHVFCRLRWLLRYLIDGGKLQGVVHLHHRPCSPVRVPGFGRKPPY